MILIFSIETGEKSESKRQREEKRVLIQVLMSSVERRLKEKVNPFSIDVYREGWGQK